MLNYFRAEFHTFAQDGPEICGGLHFSPVERRVSSDDAELEPVRQTTIHYAHFAQELLIGGQDHRPDEDPGGIAPDLLNLLQRYILAPDITVENFLVKRVQSFHRYDMHFPGKGFAVDDLKSQVLIRLGAVDLP